MVVKQKITIRLTISFLIIYTLAITVGSILLVTWGSTNWYKETIAFMISWPVKWDELIMYSFGWLFINICLWTSMVYIVLLVIENFTWKLITKIDKKGEWKSSFQLQFGIDIRVELQIPPSYKGFLSNWSSDRTKK